ncbi:hypothetical protein [Duganella sp. S19_KUP01_CR8]|uniref:hypothetical protein n=1 Tax=Duganella sp. S19_KUP01_CR8 TaxID=3025502 RepID=UPI002FCD71C5
MKRTLAAILTASVLMAFTQPSFAATIQEHRDQIQHVVETFRDSIIKKDAATFMQLFLKRDIPWIGVVSDQSLARHKTPNPGKLLPNITPKDYIDAVSQDKTPFEETFENVRIDTDGELAQVWFDYTSYNAGHKQDWGKEAWQLVKTKDGWKINSVIFSVESSPVPGR